MGTWYIILIKFIFRLLYLYYTLRKIKKKTQIFCFVFFYHYYNSIIISVRSTELFLLFFSCGIYYSTVNQ